MKIIRAAVSAALLAALFSVLPAQLASACALNDPDCNVRIDSTGIHLVDKGKDFSDPTKYAQAPSAEKVAGWKRDYWYMYPRSAEASQDWLSNFFKGGVHNPNLFARAKAEQAARDKARANDTAVNTSSFGVPEQQAIEQPATAAGDCASDGPGGLPPC